MKYMRLVPLASLLVGAVFLVGCKTHVPHSVSTGGPLMKNVSTIGRVEGESNAKYYLGGLIGPIGDDSLAAAVKDALSKKGGDSLINMTVDRAVSRYPFVMVVRTRVSGLAIRY